MGLQTLRQVFWMTLIYLMIGTIHLSLCWLFLRTTAVFPQSAVPIKWVGIIAVDNSAAHVFPALAADHALHTIVVAPKNVKLKIGNVETGPISSGGHIASKSYGGEAHTAK
jgi:hypothetical protein